MIRWLFMMPLVAASIHIVEEFAIPGGFRSWYIAYVPEVAKILTPLRLAEINALLLAACLSFAVTGQHHGGTTTWLIVVSILAWNAVFHITGAVRTRRYSPGMVTGILLYLPLTCYGTYELILHRVATYPLFGLCFAIGTVYHLLAESELFFTWARRAAGRDL